jgi:methionine synthase II (cobalamin-independent)
LYPTELRAFLDRGGIIAWGIVPVGDDEQVSRETADGVTEKLKAAMIHVASKGIPFESLLESALITPACGMGTLSEGGAVRALELLNQVSERMRKDYA